MTRPRKRPFWTLDCETDPFKAGRVPQPFLWGLYTGESYHEFATGREAADFCREQSVIVYAHNGGKFDYHYLRDEINSDELIMVINQRLAKFKIGVCEFRDSVNLIPARLADFQKEKIDYAIFEPGERDKPENRRAISDYLRSDCVNLYHVLEDYFALYSGGLTQAGAAMKFWQQQSGLKAPRSHAGEYAAYRHYYYGGRVECFRRGHVREDFNVVDINSAYPYAMLSRHPFGTRGSRLATLPDRIEEWNACLISIRGTSRGALPYRADDGSLEFPDDAIVRDYHVTGHELRAAVETDTIKIHDVTDVHHFSPTVDFREYVDHFYKIRLKAKSRGDKVQDIFAKIFLNALYGKFASQPTKYAEYVIASESKFKHWLAEGYERYDAWGATRYLMRRPLPEHKHRYYNIATAASITGYVRAHLWRSLQRCQGLIYCDTDSIAARDTSALDIGPALGQWKLEMECDQFAVAGKKLYAYHARNPSPEMIATGRDWKTASKGVILSAAEIVRVARGAEIAYQPEIPTYSVLRPEPVFIPRLVKRTGRALDS